MSVFSALTRRNCYAGDWMRRDSSKKARSLDPSGFDLIGHFGAGAGLNLTDVVHEDRNLRIKTIVNDQADSWTAVEYGDMYWDKYKGVRIPDSAPSNFGMVNEQ